MESRLVLILHPDDRLRGELCAAVRPLPVVEARSRQEAIALLGRVQPMFVVMHHEGARTVLRDIDRLAPGAVRVVLCPDDLDSRRELLEVAERQEFTTISAYAFEQLPVALQIRRSVRLSPLAHLTAAFTVLGRRLTGAVAELGNDGAALLLPTDVPVESLQPGTVLLDASMGDDSGATVLEPRAWAVRSLGHDPRGAVRLGASFLRTDNRSDAPIAAADPIRVGALIYRAARRGARFLVRAPSDDAPHVFLEGTPDPTYQTIRLRGPRARFHDGDIVHLSFELSGRVYSGLAVVQGNGPEGPTVTLPRTLRLGHRRHSLRISPAGPHRATVHFRSPLTGREVHKDLVSLHPRGAAFRFDAALEVFPDGLVLEGATLEFLGRSFPVRLSVQSTSIATPSEPVERRCGLKLEVASTEARQVLLDALISVRQPEVVDGSQLGLPRLWSLFEASAVHFPDYPPGVGPHLKVLDAGRAALGDGRSGLAKSLVWRSGEDVEAHCGGLRTYSRNWFSQHLVVRPGYRRQSHISEQIMSMMVDYAEALGDVDYVSAYWRAENRFMARMLGAVARKLAGTGLVAVSSFTRLRRDRPPELAAGPMASDADQHQRDALLSHLRATRESLWLRSKDLVPGELELESVSKRYAASGLVRRRKIGAAGGRGWALLEEMTPGLFWAELHSAFRLVLLEPQAADADEVRLSLLRWVRARVRERDREVAEGLAEPDDVPLLERLGFQNLGGAIDLTFHCSVGRQWNEELLTMFERFSASRHQRPLEDRE